MKPSKTRRTTNLRPAASSFVGRASDLSAIAKQLDGERLVSILGAGGLGKTRLAMQLAEARLDAYAAHDGGGAWFCDLSEAHDANAVASAVAATLGLELEAEGASAPLGARVGRALAARGRVFVVLDNFEGVVAHAAATVGEWLRAAPSARFLVTSRIALGLEGEQRWLLAPLDRDDALELFEKRARQVRPAFDGAADREVAGAIVDAVEHIPLAIELAATRMAVLSASQLRDRLVSARRDAMLSAEREVARHHSMRRTVLDSVGLLDARPRRVFAELACTRNGVTMEAAEAIFGADVLDDLATLARCSLLRTHVEQGDVARYSMFEVIRAVSDELANEPGHDLPGLRRAHYMHYAHEGASERIREADLENMLHAFAMALEGDAPEGPTAAITIAIALEGLLSPRGQLPRLAEMLDASMAALARAGAALPVDAYLTRGVARRELGDSAAARDDFERALAAARASKEPGLAGVALTRLGGMSDVAGDTVTARARLDDALALLAETPEGEVRSRREAEALLLLGHARRREGSLEDARASLGHAAARYRQLGHDEGLAGALYELAVVDMFAGQHDLAFARFDEGLAVAERSGSRVWTGALKTARGCMLQDLGRLDEALAHHAEAARVFRDAGTRHREASTLYYLATTYLERGEPRETEAVLRRARATLEGVGAARYEALMEACLASALAARRTADGDAEARRAITRAEDAALLVKNEPALAANVRIHRLVVDLATADAAASFAEAEALVDASPSDDSRFALRVLRRAARRDEPPPVPAALLVATGGAAFRMPGAPETVTLPAKSPLRRVLERLATRRIDEPGSVVTIEEIIAAGWPGERIASEAALNRAYVALASLRKLGLRDVLLHEGGGYAITESVVVRLVDAV